MLWRNLWLAIVAGVLLLAVGFPAFFPTKPPNKQQGMSFAVWWPGEYQKPEAALSLRNLQATGADWISLIVTGYQDNLASTTITRAAPNTPSDDDLIHIIRLAHRLGLKVMLKPHLNLLQEKNYWQGEIGQAFVDEKAWQAWFASYEAFIAHYATLSQTQKVDLFCLGGELQGTTAKEKAWRQIVARVRQIYSGPITYAANYGGEETAITWWDAVDFIGVDAYYPLTDKTNPSREELKAAWQPSADRLRQLSVRWKKPILITEIGYRSWDGANRRPWQWQTQGGRVDLQEQADCYQATFETVYRQPWCAGIYWWYWQIDPFAGGPYDDSYTPQDKPAEEILRAWWR